MKPVLVALCFCALAAHACDIIIHVKSQTANTFSAQVTSPNGKKTEKWTFTKNRQQETFQEKAKECGLGDFEIKTFDQAGKEVKSVKVALNGIGRVLYHVDDALTPTQVERQGAICNGQCAPLGKTVEHKSRPNSPTPSS